MRFEQQIGEIQNRRCKLALKNLEDIKIEIMVVTIWKEVEKWQLIQWVLIFTKIHPETCCFVLMDGALLAVGFTLAKNCGFKSLLQPIIIVLRQSSVDDTTHPWVPLMCKRQRSWDSSSCWKFDEQASLWIFGMRVVSSSMKAQSVMQKKACSLHIEEPIMYLNWLRLFCHNPNNCSHQQTLNPKSIILIFFSAAVNFYTSLQLVQFQQKKKLKNI